MMVDEKRAAEEYYQRIMGPDDVLLLKNLLPRIRKAPHPARDYLLTHCRDVRELGQFFKDREHLFFVDNGRVALTSEELEVAPQLASSYFERKLRNFRKPVNYKVLKSHVDRAPDGVERYIRSFYPGEEFKRFLKQRPELFKVRKDGWVSLIEIESVAFFKQRLKVFGGDLNKIPFNCFRGHVGQAPPEIQTYMNNCFDGDAFQTFLLRNSDVFQLDRNGDVSLVPFV